MNDNYVKGNGRDDNGRDRNHIMNDNYVKGNARDDNDSDRDQWRNWIRVELQ